MQFAMFDHLAVHETKAEGRVKLALPAGTTRRRPKITVRASSATPTLLEFPPWMQQSIGKVPIIAVHVESDGTSIVVSNNGVVGLVDAEHRVEYGLEIPAMRIDDAHRIGSIVIVSAQDPNEAMSSEFPGHSLIGIDATTGTIAWRTDSGRTTSRFAVWGGYAVTSTGRELHLYTADTGELVGGADATTGPFLLVTDATGIHGVPDSSAPVMAEHGIDLTLE